MRVYLPGRKGYHTVTCTPGNLHDVSQWKDEDGQPVTYRVQFVEGVASVDAQLGKWLIEMGYAAKTPLWLPATVRRALAV